ncbi:MAG TPA: hypothetical protein VFX56_08905, partial [Nitrospira sp.]|nr:hypothetical protein [Nitrospira sp.]
PRLGYQDKINRLGSLGIEIFLQWRGKTHEESNENAYKDEQHFPYNKGTQKEWKLARHVH